MTALEQLKYRLESRTHDYRMIEHSQHSFDVGKRAAIRQEIDFLKRVIIQLQEEQDGGIFQEIRIF